MDDLINVILSEFSSFFLFIILVSQTISIVQTAVVNPALPFAPISQTRACQP
jgi:hypothetical protein